MVKQGHGATQFMAWRQGYNVKPTPVSSFRLCILETTKDTRSIRGM
jgi:hypothetical protein